MSRDPALHRALSLRKSKDLAVFLGISPQAVSRWRRCPAQRVISVERFTGIKRSELRPDIYPLDAVDAVHE